MQNRREQPPQSARAAQQAASQRPDRRTSARTSQRGTRPLAADRRKSAAAKKAVPKAVQAQAAPSRARSWLPAAALALSMLAVATGMVLAADEGSANPAASEPLPSLLPVQSAPSVSSVSTAVSNVDDLFTVPYDWDNLTTDDRGRITYEQDGQTVSRTGVDVSEHQQEIDWEAVAADGIDFAIIRVGYRGASSGTVVQDTTFEHNLQAAHDAGLDVGVYFYSLATTPDEAREEAEFAVASLDGTSLEYPIVFDMEPTMEVSDRLRDLNKDEITAIARAFCETVEAAGYHATVYGNQTDLSRYHLMQLAAFGFWYAQYDDEPTMGLNFALWQYTQQGEVKGISHAVDLDLDLTAAR